MKDKEIAKGTDIQKVQQRANFENRLKALKSDEQIFEAQLERFEKKKEYDLSLYDENKLAISLRLNETKEQIKNIEEFLKKV